MLTVSTVSTVGTVGCHGYNVNRQIKFIPLAYMTVLDVTC